MWDGLQSAPSYDTPTNRRAMDKASLAYSGAAYLLSHVGGVPNCQHLG